MKDQPVPLVTRQDSLVVGAQTGGFVVPSTPQKGSQGLATGLSISPVKLDPARVDGRESLGVLPL